MNLLPKQKFSDFEKHIILMDEMKILENLVISKYSGELVGFIDLGDPEVNLATWQDRNKLAAHVLVFLVASLLNPFKFPLANFGTNTASATQIFPLFWKAVDFRENKCGLKVMELT